MALLAGPGTGRRQAVSHVYESEEATETLRIEAAGKVAKWANARALDGWELVSFSVDEPYVYAVFRRPVTPSGGATHE